VAEEDYDQQVEVVYDATCCEEVRNVIARQIPKTRLEEQLSISCPAHGTEYGVTRHDDGTFTVKPAG
jgi:hypothetical protein